jgi:5-hydroxyisourate hydrolase
MFRRLPALLPLLLAATAADASVSTHVLDLDRGVGAADVPVTLEMQAIDGSWRQVASAKTDANGRVRAFPDAPETGAGTYRLTFALAAAPAVRTANFFPEISITFRVTDAAAHYHVPVVVSPFGYSTYRGN